MPIFRQEMIVPPEAAAGDGAPGHSYLTTPGHSYLTTPGVVSDPAKWSFSLPTLTVTNQISSCHLFETLTATTTSLQASVRALTLGRTRCSAMGQRNGWYWYDSEEDTSGMMHAR